jgi:hypothetical protein
MTAPCHMSLGDNMYDHPQLCPYSNAIPLIFHLFLILIVLKLLRYIDNV